MPNPRAVALAQLDGSFVFGAGGTERRDFVGSASPAALLAARRA